MRRIGFITIIPNPALTSHSDVGGDEAALTGEGDAIEVVGEGLANDVGYGTVGCGAAADAVVLGDHGLSR